MNKAIKKVILDLIAQIIFIEILNSEERGDGEG